MASDGSRLVDARIGDSKGMWGELADSGWGSGWAGPGL